MTRRLWITALFTLLYISIATAQNTSGQVCIRAFEDRNSNGLADNNEPPITRGISVSLADSTGVIIASQLIENSNTASSGRLCFQGLTEGEQYTVRVISANYQATSSSEFITGAQSGTTVEFLPYGAQVIPVESATDTSTLSQEERVRSTLIRSIFAGLGALVIMGAMAVVGALIYFFVLRNRARPATGVYQPVPGTGEYPAVTGTGQFAPVPTPPTPESTPAVNLDDTDMPDVVTQEDIDEMYSDDYEDVDTNTPAQRINSNPYDDTLEDDFTFEDEEDDAPFKPPAD